MSSTSTESSAGHTPGPWAVRRHDDHEWHIDMREPRYGEALNWHSAVIVYGIEDEGDLGAQVAEANARLIAASPMLLDACKQALELFEDDEGIAHVLHAAIAAAEGR